MTAPGRVRGRVLARDGDDILVRAAAGEVRASPAGSARPGDLIEIPAPGARPVVVRAGGGGDYPAPGSEVARMPRRRLDRLAARARALAAIRRFFDERGFVEVEPPLLVRSPGLEVHLRAVEAGRGRYLITSPEYHMKRLLCAGMERIYSLGRCFRADEVGVHHSEEFTMLEWYRAWDDLAEVARDTEELSAEVARAVTGKTRVSAGGRELELAPPWPRETVRDLFAREVGIELAGDESAEELRRAVAGAGVEVGEARAWDDVFFAAFLARVEPGLAARDRPVLVGDWPAPLSALARARPDDPRVVERFEAYAGGLELANAFGELTDPDEQRRRLEEDRRRRLERGLPDYPIDERFLAALAEGLPPSAGIALGVDRLVMLVTGAETIAEVQAFSGEEV